MSTWQLLFLSGSVSPSKIPQSFKLCHPPRSSLVAHSCILKDKWLVFIRVEASLKNMLFFILLSYLGLQGPICPGSKEAQWFLAQLQHGHPWMVRNYKVSSTGPWTYNGMNASNTGRWALLASCKLWRVQTLSKELSLTFYTMEKGLWPLGILLHALGFQMARKIKKVTWKGKLWFFLLKSSDRFCWPPHRIEVSPKYLPPVCSCTSSAACPRDPATQTPDSSSGTAVGTTVQDFLYSLSRLFPSGYSHSTLSL